MKQIATNPVSLVLILFIAVSAAPLAAAEGDYLSPLAIVADSSGETLYIAEVTANQIAVFNPAEQKVTKTISLPDTPTGLVLSPDGTKLYVTGDGAKGKVHIIDTASAKVTGSIDVGNGPTGPAVSPDGKTLYVCNQFDNDVSVIDLTAGEETGRISGGSQPVAAAVTPDGRHLLIADLVPGGSADTNYTAAKVTIVKTAGNKVIAEIGLLNGSTGLRQFAVTPDSKFAYVTHILSRYQLPTTQLERGWMNTNALSIIDIENAKLFNTVLLDDVDLGAANPWAIVLADDAKYICVTQAGTHELSVIDRAGLHEKLDKIEAGEKVSNVSAKPEDVPNDLSFLVDLRRRIKLTGNGPRGLAVIGTKAWVTEYFTDTLSVVDIDPDIYPKPRSIALGKSAAVTDVRKGEMYFHDATLCFQKWQSCSSCHPSESRPDGLNWDLLNDGIGNPKNTKSLVLAHKTPPAMITGVRENAELAVRAGIRHIQFAVRPEADAVAIDEYLKSLKPRKSPRLVERGFFRKRPGLNKSAERGKKLFETTGCGRCHPAPLYTDLKKHDVGSAAEDARDTVFDTPTLVEVWRTGPYLHNGKAATIKDVLTTFNKADSHGTTSNLSDKEIADLAEFVLSQ